MGRFSWISVLLCWAGQKIQYVQQSGKFCVRADTQSWLNKSHKVDARTLVCVRPPAQYPLQNKLNSESLNYAARKVRPLKAKKDNLGVVSVIALRPVAAWIQEEVKASHVSFGQPLGERRMKWEVLAKMLSTAAFRSPAFYSNHSRHCWQRATSKHSESQI